MKLSPFTYLVVFVLAACLLWSCAKTGQLTGGPRDRQPPAVVLEKSTANYQTNYFPQEIVLYFDEFIELKNLDKNLLISPPMFDLPEIKQRGKRLRIIIPEDEMLRPDATYSISMGDAITDFTEGNPLEGYRFVFATGDQLDSLSLQGSIIDGYTGEPVKEALLMLYDVLADSIAGAERPFYLVKTDENGLFNLENIKNDTFQIIALKDDNFNYMYDLDTEGVGFADSLVVLTDSTKVRPKIRLFFGVRQPVLVEKNYKVFGRAYHLYDRSVEGLSVSVLYPTDWAHTVELEQDTFRLWYQGPIDSVTVQLGNDTFVVKPPKLDTVFTNEAIGLKARNKEIAPWDTLTLIGVSLLANIDTSLIRVYRLEEAAQTAVVDSAISTDTLTTGESTIDSLLLLPDSLGIDTLSVQLDTTVTDGLVADTVVTDTVNNKIGRGQPKLDTVTAKPVVLDTFIKEGTYGMTLNRLSLAIMEQDPGAYEVAFLPGAFTDVFGRTNDSLVVAFAVQDSSQYGTISLDIADLEDSTAYMVELQLKEKLVDRYPASILDDSITFTKLPLNTYTVLIIEDTDGNGKWTTGDYWSKRQPENVKRYKLEPLRANFDLSTSISWTKAPAAAEEAEEEREGPPEENRPRAPDPKTNVPKEGRGGRK